MLCLYKISDCVRDPCLEVAGIELYCCWGFIELDREGKRRIKNGQMWSLNVVKQRDVIVRNCGEKHVERIQGNGLQDLAIYCRPGKREI